MPPLPDAVKIRLSALLLSQDDELVSVVRDVGRSMSIKFDICSDLRQATKKVATTKYQGVLVDYANDLSADALIDGVRGSTSNAADVVYAFVTNAYQADAARRLGANFVVPQPFTFESIAPYIRAGYGLMVHELRRYFRAPVVFPVDLVSDDGRRLAARSIDLSSGGLAISAPESLTAGQVFDAFFRIPGSSDAIEVRVIVCWSDETRRAGLRFDMPSQIAESPIQRWLRVRIDEELCLEVSNSRLVGSLEA